MSTTTKPRKKPWMQTVKPPIGGVIYAAPDCKCVFVHDEGHRFWERCDEHGGKAL